MYMYMSTKLYAVCEASTYIMWAIPTIHSVRISAQTTAGPYGVRYIEIKFGLHAVLTLVLE